MDIRQAQKSIYIEIPGLIDEDEEALAQLSDEIRQADHRGVAVYVKLAEKISVPKWVEPFAHRESYVTTPFTLIDQEVIWFGEPLSAADFLSGGTPLPTEHFPCLRFKGTHTGRLLKAIYEIPTLK